MNLDVNKEFKDICIEILDEKKSEIEWAEIESSDMFQSDNYCGGYDATEMAFCFSFYDIDNREFWFQLTLNDIEDIITNNKTSISLSEV